MLAIILKSNNKYWKRTQFLQNHIYFPEGLAPIHLEVYPNETREPLLMGSLVELFIICFNKVKAHGTIHTRKFLTKLNGNCIDARTRSAFDFALDLDAVATFTDLVQTANERISVSEQSYFRLFVEMLNTTWGTPFKADKGLHGFYRFNGLLNSDVIAYLQSFMMTLLVLDPGEDCLSQLEKVSPHLQQVYFVFLSKTPCFNKLIQLIPSETYSEKWLKSSSILNKYPQLGKLFNVWDECALASIKRLSKNTKLIVSSELNDSYLNIACRLGDKELAKTLMLDSRSLFKVNEQGLTPLDIICLYGHIELLIQILKVDLGPDELIRLEEIVISMIDKEIYHVADIIISRLFLSIDRNYTSFPKNLFLQILVYFSEKVLNDNTEKVLCSLINKLDSDTIESFFVIKTNGVVLGSKISKLTAAGRALISMASPTTQALTNNFYAEKQAETLLFRADMSEKNVSTLSEKLYLAIRDNANLHFKVVNGLKLEKALLMNQGNELLWIYAFTHARKGLLTDLLEHVSDEALSAALGKSDNDGWTILHIAIRYQDAANIQTLIARASPESINKALVQCTSEGWTPLHMSLCYQEAVINQCLIAAASSEAISTALTKKNNDGWTALHMALCYQKAEVNQALLERALPEALNTALVQKNSLGWTGLHVALRYQEAATNQILLTQALPELINALLVQRTSDGLTGLDFMLRYQNITTNQAFITRISLSPLSQNTLYTFVNDVESTRVVDGVIVKTLAKEKNILSSVLFQLLTRFDNLPINDLKTWKAHKHLIKDYILAMPESKQKSQILNKALNPALQLGLFFTLRRGFLTPRNTRGALKELSLASANIKNYAEDHVQVTQYRLS